MITPGMPPGPTIDAIMFTALVVESVLCVGLVLAVLIFIKWGRK